jgi:glycerol-3-phosphate dehydrogenase (NAD(P)+)
MNITILGGGAFGTALAIHLSKKHSPTIWEHFAERIHQLQSGHCNLLNITVPSNITISQEKNLENSDVIIIAVASAYVRQTMLDVKLPENSILVLASKGFDDSLELLSTVIPKTNPLTLLYGPTIAKELAGGIITGATIASSNHETAKTIQELFQDEKFIIDTTDDIIGVQVGSALKNVYAVWGGIIDGLQLGNNTKALVMTKGLHELTTLGIAMGAKKETFSSLAGLGDLIVTCTSPDSRNRTFGEKLGQGKTKDEALSEMNMVVEGIHTVKIAVQLAQKHNVPMPLAEQLHKVLFENKNANKALKDALQ